MADFHVMKLSQSVSIYMHLCQLYVFFCAFRSVSVSIRVMNLYSLMPRIRICCISTYQTISSCCIHTFHRTQGRFSGKNNMAEFWMVKGEATREAGGVIKNPCDIPLYWLYNRD